MNAPAQIALPTWLATRQQIQQQILERLSTNIRKINDCDLEALTADAGWSVVIRLPRLGIGAEQLLSLAEVVVHPGSFYGIAEPGRIVVSLITPEIEFSTGVERIAKLAK